MPISSGSSNNTLDINTSGSSGTLLLSTANTATGGISLNGGFLSVGVNNALNASLLTFYSGKLEANSNNISLNSNYTVTANDTGAIGGSHSINLGGAGTLNTGSTLDVIDTSSVTFSTLSAGTTGGVGVLTQTSGGSVTFNGQVGSSTSPLNNISVAGALTIGSSGGAVYTSGAQSYSGATLDVDSTFQGGLLTFSNAVVGSGLGSENLVINTSSASSSISGVLGSSMSQSNIGSLTVNYAGGYTGTLSLTNANYYSGVTTIDAGKLSLTNTGALGASSNVSVASGATFDLDFAGLLANSANIGLSGSASVTGSNVSGSTLNNNLSLGSSSTIGGLSPGLLILQGVISDGGNNYNLTKTGTGTLILNNSSANTYGGTTAVNGGILEITADNSLSAAAVMVASGAELALNGSNLTIANSLTINNNGVSSAGALVDLSSANGNSDIYSGPVSMASDSGIGVTTSGVTLTLSQVLSSTGTDALTKYGAGTLVLDNANTYSGGTTVSAGTLQITNNTGLGQPSVANYATVNLGATLILPIPRW